MDEECLCHTNPFDEDFLRDILQQPQEAIVGGDNLMMMMMKNNNNNSSMTMINAAAPKSMASPPTTYTLSFDKSAAFHVPSSAWNEVSHSQQHTLPLSSSRPKQGTKKTRNASETLDHIMSERHRRQELTRKFIALSATIPGLKKMDKAHVLREAINYVKELEERVKELEEDIQKNGVESVITITRSHLFMDDETNEAVPEVEARVLGKEVLIKIHCGNQKGILLQIMSQLERLHLYISTSNVLPFGNTLDITIIAQMGDRYNLIVKDLVKELRRVAVIKPCDVQQ
ncbi:hypothetical protein RJT34_25588 [Clitoria ternatea]|uniref:BHLH domain-containing protein n=1 Tax=Clitoria ternatea TaxID=43366 RepID=A0AAN9IIY7_CLITE